MKSIRSLILASAILSLVFAMSIFFINVLWWRSVINVIVGLFDIYLYTCDLKKLNKYSGIITTFGVIQLLTNLTSGILLLVASNKARMLARYLDDDYISASMNTNINNKGNNNPVIQEKRKIIPIIPPEAKRIDILLKLGVALVILSGVIFATSSWNAISSFTKTLFILLLGVLFALLSKFFKEKVKIKSSEVTYDILSKTFILCSIISIGFLGTFGDWLSFTGEGSELSYALITICASIILYISKKKYENKPLCEFAYSLLLITLVLVLSQFEVNIFIIMSVLSLIILLFSKNNDDNKKYIFIVNNIMLLILCY